jgi:hypothetical protein
MNKHTLGYGLVPLAIFLALAGVTCSSRSDRWVDGDVDVACRSLPGDCEGEIGGACSVTDDCSDGVCCHDKNCGNGTCTYVCKDNIDCPGSMRCEHGYCFFECKADNDCGPGQKCEHGGTICEYEGGD